ncbi:M trans-acting positive regulator (MGA) HTH domain protein [Streptococcus mitis]|uniref:M trans-acting positive regulator (MGA) HTH domain protein n=1 Tax=Streptococcus mitis TaxID=28037 RepID=A0A081Q9B6_STRMT|nr:M protein trans-acting positive regulator PRD domain-containing protein [Streptococcus mitis]KEQ39539.1 M trans-acting positive regulator (MGA) HTH domain protein [Streptococcus mitis]
MNILLSETEQNLLVLLEELTKHHDWIELPGLAENLNFSIEELQEHLSRLEQLFPNLLIQSTKESIQLQFDFQNTLDPRIAIFEQSTTYSFLNRLFFKEGLSLEQMCQELVISCERVQKIIQHLNTKLPQHYGISIQPSPLVMDGTEEDIRAFYLDYFSQSYDFLDWPFPSISEEALTQLIQLFLDAQQVSPNLSSLRQIKYTLAINLERLNKGRFIENPSPLLTSHYSSLMQISQFEQDIKKLAKKLDFEATKETLEQLFSDPIKSPQITNKPNNGALGDIHHIQKSYRLLSQILEELAKEFHLQIENREELIWLLHYTAQSDFFHLLSDQSLDKQRFLILSNYQAEFPKLFEVSQHKFRYYLTEMGLENHPSKLQELVYTFSIQGRRILVQLLQKLPKIRVLVISHLDSHHAQNLIDTLTHYGNNLYLFDSWEESTLSFSIFNQIPHDIVITTFPISNCPKPIICSRNLSTSELFHHLHLLASQIHKERLAKS